MLGRNDKKCWYLSAMCKCMNILCVRSQVSQETLYLPQNLLQLTVEGSVDKNRRTYYEFKSKVYNHITMKNQFQNTVPVG